MSPAERRDRRQRGQGQRRARHDTGGASRQRRHTPGTVGETGDTAFTATLSSSANLRQRPISGVPKRDIKGSSKRNGMHCISTEHFLTDIIGYDGLKLYLKIYPPPQKKIKSWVLHCDPCVPSVSLEFAECIKESRIKRASSSRTIAIMPSLCIC